MPPRRGAIVGFGNVARNGHWPAYRGSSAFEIVAVVDPSAERRAAARALADSVRVYATIDDLARHENLDFVDICTPPSAHETLAARALELGWHVLCEKPLTLDVEAFGRLAGLAERASRVLFTVHNWKMAPIVRGLCQAIGAGTVGAVRRVDVFTWRNQACKGTAQGASGAGGDAPEDWRQHRATAGGGVLVDHGWHAFYLVLAMVKADPRHVRASLHLPGGPDTLEDSMDVVVSFPSAEAGIHLTWRASNRRNLIVVHGDRGSLAADDDRLIVMPGEGAWSERSFDAPLSGGSHHADWFGPLLSVFEAEIESPAQRGENLREAGWCVALMNAAYRAECGGGAVEVAFPSPTHSHV
jgi:predicted dehydrogenase